MLNKIPLEVGAIISRHLDDESFRNMRLTCKTMEMWSRYLLSKRRNIKVYVDDVIRLTENIGALFPRLEKITLVSNISNWRAIADWQLINDRLEKVMGLRDVRITNSISPERVRKG